MDISLTQGGTTVLFPVLPETYEVSDSQNNTTVNINATGEINLLGKPTLTQISWNGLFPAQDDDYVQDLSMSPVEYVNALLRMKETGVCDLHLLDVLADHVTIESLTYSEKDGTGDIYYSITLKKYIYISANGVVDVEVSKSRPNPETPRNSSKTYTVKAGDSLWQIARREMNSSDWKSLYNANKDAIGSDPNLLKVGTVINLT